MLKRLRAAIVLPDAKESRELKGLTGLRGFAAVWVVACHAWYLLGQPSLQLGGLSLRKILSEGWLGVLLFFILSGRLLAPPFLRWRLDGARQPELKSYLARRILRVFPAYYLQLALLTMGFVLVHRHWPFAGFADLLAHLSMLFDPLAEVPSILNPVWWTLPVELTFYLCLPLLAYVLTRASVLPVLGLCLALFLVYHYLGMQLYDDSRFVQRSLFSRQFPGYLFAFAIGIAIAQWQYREVSPHPEQRGRSTLLLGAASLALVWLIYLLPTADAGREFWVTPSYYYLWKPAVCLSLGAFVFLAAAPQSLLEKHFSRAAWTYLGRISYSIYLWHFPVIVLVSQLSADSSLSNAGRWLLAVGLTSIAAHLSARFVEIPAIAYGTRRFGRNGRPESLRTSPV